MTNNNPTNNTDPVKKAKRPISKKIHWGIGLGGGLSKLAVTNIPFSTNDTLRTLGVTGKTRVDLGILGQIDLGNTVSVRPSLFVSFERSDIHFERRRATGGPITETIPVETISFKLPIPFIFRLSGKKVAPYIIAGPVLSYVSQATDENSDRLPVSSIDVLGDGGVGVDIGIPKAGIVISPEIKYSRGLLETKDGNSSTPYTRVIEKINKQGFTLSIHLRRR